MKVRRCGDAFDPTDGRGQLLAMRRVDAWDAGEEGVASACAAACAGRRGNADGTVVGKLARLDHAAEDANDADIHAPFRATTLSCVGWKSAACPYKIDETLLVVGEADFSWSASLSRRRREDGRSQSGGTRCSHRCFVGACVAVTWCTIDDARTHARTHARTNAGTSLRSLARAHLRTLALQ
eukprot:6205136-Pleurochrysis_carterae.AAC.1